MEIQQRRREIRGYIEALPRTTVPLIMARYKDMVLLKGTPVVEVYSCTVQGDATIIKLMKLTGYEPSEAIDARVGPREGRAHTLRRAKQWTDLANMMTCAEPYIRATSINHPHPHIAAVRATRAVVGVGILLEMGHAGEPLSMHMATASEHALSFAKQLLSALAHCHARGVAHCDVDEGNICVRDGVYKLTDFGAARFMPFGEPTAHVNSLQYKAPEIIALSHDMDERVDVWALGCIVLRLAYPDAHPFPPYGGAEVVGPHVVATWLQAVSAACLAERDPGDGAWRRRSDTVSLLQAMLAVEPLFRATAAVALHHRCLLLHA